MGVLGAVRARSLSWIAACCMFAGCATVRPVEPGTVYRAEGLSTSQFEQAVKDNQIRTVVNLRGFDPNARWYKEQVEVCKQLQVKQVDVELAKGDPRREEVIQLLETFKAAEKPILVTGDRRSSDVGFASGLYRIAVLNQPKDQARAELPFWQSERLEAFGVGRHDRFLYEWRDEREFYEKYQLAETRRQPRAARLPGQGTEPPVVPIAPNAVQLGEPIAIRGGSPPGL